MSLDTTIALINEEEYRDFAGIDTDKDINEEQLALLINSASQFIIDFTGRKFIAGTHTHIFGGDGERNYFVPYPPLTADATLYYKYGYDPSDSDYWKDASDNYYFTQANDTGEMYFTDGTVFNKGQQNWRIIYSYGYARASIPSDLKKACFELVHLARKHVMDNAFGLQSKSVAGTTTSYEFTKIPQNVLETLNRYKRVG